MGYEGASLADIFEAAKEPTRSTARDLAEAAGKREVEITKENTPVEGFVKDLADHGHLRDKIDLKDIRVYTEGDATVYETGAETNVVYAPYVEHGTGLWGPKGAKYEIRPKRPDGWLSWIARKPYTRRDGTAVKVGDRVFAKKVMHPGSPGQHMFAIGVEMAEFEFEEYTRDIMRQWAEKVEEAFHA